MRIFEIATPDGRKLRHAGETPEAAAARLLPGYALTGEVVGAALEPPHAGGHLIPVAAGQSPLAILLQWHGEDLRAWLKANGFTTSESA